MDCILTEGILKSQLFIFDLQWSSFLIAQSAYVQCINLSRPHEGSRLGVMGKKFPTIKDGL